MSMDGEWTSIRPWNPLIQLSVREITSISATFILSSPSSVTESIDIEIDAADDDDEQQQKDKSNVISDALAKGLSVNVNGTHWDRVLIRIDEKVDEAVIIIYNLMPGRQYDIDLGLVQGRNLHQQVIITAESEGHDLEGQNGHADTQTSTSAAATGDPSSLSASSSPSNGPVTLEDHIIALQHQLHQTNSERDQVTTSIKAARRESQKADAALKAEIERLKSQSEKYAATEHRAKQKTLALQEAVKQAQSARTQIGEDAKELEATLPELKGRREEKEKEWNSVKETANEMKRQREEDEDRERKAIEGMKSELVALGNKAERLSNKKEKLENTTIVDLEKELRELEREIEEAEAAAAAATSNTSFVFPSLSAGQGYTASPGAMSTSMPEAADEDVQQKFLAHHGHGSPVRQARISQSQSSPSPGTIGRPQRPSPSASVAVVPPRQQQQQQKSGSVSLHSPSLLPSASGSAAASSTSLPGSSSPSSTLATATTSLNLRAAPFHPGRPIALSSSGAGPGPGPSESVPGILHLPPGSGAAPGRDPTRSNSFPVQSQRDQQVKRESAGSKWGVIGGEVPP